MTLCPQLFASVLLSLAEISEGFYITVVTWSMTKTCVDQLELINVGKATD